MGQILQSIGDSRYSKYIVRIWFDGINSKEWFRGNVISGTSCRTKNTWKNWKHFSYPGFQNNMWNLFSTQRSRCRWLVWYAETNATPKSRTEFDSEIPHRTGEQQIGRPSILTTSLKQIQPILVKIGYKNVQTILSEHRSQQITNISVHPVSCFNTSSFQQNAKSRPGMLVKISLDCLKEVSPVLSPQNMLLWLDAFWTTMRLMRTNVWWTP